MRAWFLGLLLVPAIACAQDADVNALRAQLRALQDQLAADKSRIAELEARQGSAGIAEVTSAARAQVAEVQRNFDKMKDLANSTIKSVQTEDKAVNDRLLARDTACEATNQKLFATAEDILHLYETQSFRTVLLKSYEPILGLDKVKLQNIVQSYDDQIRDHQIAASPTGVQTP